MARATTPSGIEIEYEVFGDPSKPVMLWIMGFGAQMTAWDEPMLAMFVDRGYCCIRFDNRDCGLSTKLDGVAVDPAAVLKAHLFGDQMPPVPYTLSDMAADACAVLDAVGIQRAHVIGASMGGMIAQTFAIEHPGRTLTLTSIMSNPGDIEVGQPTPEAAEVLFSPPPTSREDYIAASERWKVWMSKKYFDAADVRARAAREYDRCFYPEGSTRQLAAIYASGSRVEALGRLTVPTLVLHGAEDTLLPLPGGEATARAIPGARLVVVEDMSHDLPRPLWPLYVDEICALAESVAV